MIQRAEQLAGHHPSVVGRPTPDYRVEPGDERHRIRAAHTAHLVGEPVPNSPDRILARFDQQLGGLATASIPTQIEPEEIEPLFEVHDPRLVLVEDQTPRRQPCRQPRLDLFGLLPRIAADHHVIGVPHQNRCSRNRIPGVHTGQLVADTGGLLQAMQRNVHQQRTDHPALGRTLLGRREPPALDHPRPQPALNHPSCGKTVERIEKPSMVDPVERGRQIGIQNPHPLGAWPIQGGIQGADRVGAATTRPKPVGTGSNLASHSASSALRTRA